jgi:hypothetical protein
VLAPATPRLKTREDWWTKKVTETEKKLRLRRAIEAAEKRQLQKWQSRQRRPLTERNSVSIPVSKLSEGIAFCGLNISMFLFEIDKLMTPPVAYLNGGHAAAFAVYALEELAKYSEMVSAQNSAKGETVQFDKRLFGSGRGSHQYKLEIAMDLLPKEAFEIFSNINPSVYDRDVYTPDEFIVSGALRLASIYVDRRDGWWLYFPPVVAGRLLKLRQEIEKALKNLSEQNTKSHDS